MRLVTDHALLRWLERVEGYNTEAIRRDDRAGGESGEQFILCEISRRHHVDLHEVEAKILTTKVLNALTRGDEGYRRGNISLRFKGGVIATIVVHEEIEMFARRLPQHVNSRGRRPRAIRWKNIWSAA